MSWKRASRSPLPPDPDQGFPTRPSDSGSLHTLIPAGDQSAGDDLRLDLGGALEEVGDAVGVAVSFPTLIPRGGEWERALFIC